MCEYGIGTVLGAGLLEVIKLFAFDDTAHELVSVKVLSGSESHSVQVVSPGHRCKHISPSLKSTATLTPWLFERPRWIVYRSPRMIGRRRTAPRRQTFAWLRRRQMLASRSDNKVEAVLTLLQLSVRLLVVRALEALCEPGRLAIWHSGQITRERHLDLRRLALDLADLESLILGLLEDFLSVQSVKRSGGILTSYTRRIRSDESRGLSRYLPTLASVNTTLPPGCILANLDRSYTIESMMTHRSPDLLC